MLTINIPPSEVGIFLAILLRMSIVLFMTPLFSSTQIPQTIKAITALTLAAILYFLLRKTVQPIPFELASTVRVVIGEIVFGIVVSLSFLIILAAFQFAGELISFQMGFGMAQVVDPQSGAQVTVFSGMFQLIAILLFLNLNGHHLVLKALVESFATIPVGEFTLTSNTFSKVILLSGQMFVIGIKMAAPVMVVLLLTHVGLGLMSKFAPEINILIVSFPLTIILGVLFLALSISIWGNAMDHYLGNLFHFLRGITG
jgi:flagellar biosynthetic protein FliR